MPIGCQKMKLLFDYLVAFTGEAFQAPPVEDRDLAAAVADEPFMLKSCGRNGHTSTAHAEHRGNEFVCERNFV